MTGINTALSKNIDVTRCARCGDDHKKLKATKLRTPYYFPDDLKKGDPYWYEAVCPKTSEVIRYGEFETPKDLP